MKVLCLSLNLFLVYIVCFLCIFHTASQFGSGSSSQAPSIHHRSLPLSLSQVSSTHRTSFDGTTPPGDHGVDNPMDYDLVLVEPAVSAPPPWELDVMLTDMDSSILHGSISNMLGFEYLAVRSSNESSSWPIRGIIHGTNSRLMVCAATSLSLEKAAVNGVNVKVISVHYLVDIGSPYSYLSEEAVKALSDESFYYDLYDTIPVVIQGIPMDVNVSPTKSHFKEVCLLGADFMRAIQGELHAYYGGKKSLTIVNGF